MSEAPLIPGPESLEDRTENLFEALRLAIKFDRAAILFAIYRSEMTKIEVEEQLQQRLQPLGQQLTHVYINPSNHDLPLYLRNQADRTHTVFSVSGIRFGGGTDGRDAYRALNIRREYFGQHRLRVIFWLTEQEEQLLPREAPDFWAFRHQVIPFLDTPHPSYAHKHRDNLAHWELGQSRFEDTEAKIAYRERLLAELPTDPETYYSKAQLLLTLAPFYITQKKREQAVQTLDQALTLLQQLSQLNEFAYPHYELGIVYRELKQYDNAIEHFQRAINLDPSNAVIYHYLGLVYRDSRKYVEAIKTFEQATALDPNNRYLWANLGMTYRLLQQYDQAINAFQQAILLDPKDAYPHNGLGLVYQNLKQYDQAINAYQQAISINPDAAYLYVHLGNVYRDLKQYDEAINAYQQAILLDPKDATPHNGLGLVYRHLKQYDEATNAYQQAIDLDPDYVTPHYGLGFMYHDLKQYDRAINAYQQAINIGLIYPHYYYYLGNVYRDLKQYDEAINAYQQAIRLDPKDATLHTGLGNVYRDLKQYDEAINAYQQAILLDPKYDRPHNGLGLVYRRLKQYDNAINAYQQAISINPDAAYLYYNLGIVYCLLGQQEKAVGAFERAVALDPDDGSSHTSLAMAYQALGNAEGYVRHLRLAEGLMAKEDVYNRACFAAASGDTDKALTLLAQALEEGAGTKEWARQDPDFIGLHGEARFWALVGANEEA